MAKSLLMSKFSYVLQSLSLPENALTTIDRILFKFIWQRKSSDKKAFEKIKRNVLCRDIQEG